MAAPGGRFTYWWLPSGTPTSFTPPVTNIVGFLLWGTDESLWGADTIRWGV